MDTKTKIEEFYRAFREISHLVHSSRTSKELMALAMSSAAKVLRAKGALLRLRNAETGEFNVAAAFGLGEEFLARGLVLDKSMFAGSPVNKVYIIEDIWNEPRVNNPQAVWDEGVRMILDVPLTIQKEMIGLMRTYIPERRTFLEEELDFLVAVGQQCACAIEKTRMIETQQAKFDHFVLKTDKLSALGRMAAGVAHEINNPLAGILLYSSSMRKKVPEKGALREGLDVIINETKRCKKIIEELLEFSRDKEPNRAPSDINEVVEKAFRILENEFRIKRVHFEKRLSGGMGKVLLDEVQMEQVFVNLFMNALQATGEEGKVTVETSLDPHRHCVWVEVTDTGCGIPRKEMSRIFEPFFSTKPNGTGLGLAVSYRIVRNHLGEMEVLSEKGKGTRFIIELPVIRAASAGGGSGGLDGIRPYFGDR